MYSTKLKEVKEQSNKILKYYFEFATKDILAERENKDVQCSSNSLYLYELRFELCFIYTKDILTERENKVKHSHKNYLFFVLTNDNFTDVIGLVTSISPIQDFNEGHQQSLNQRHS
jgi:hypothetical protein